jgi:hypothetical protein
MSFAQSYIASLAYWGSFVEEIGNTHPFHRRVHDGPPSLLPHHAGRNDVVAIQARSPFTVSEALHDLGGKKAEAPGTPCIFLGAASELSL